MTSKQTNLEIYKTKTKTLITKKSRIENQNDKKIIKETPIEELTPQQKENINIRKRKKIKELIQLILSENEIKCNINNPSSIIGKGAYGSIFQCNKEGYDLAIKFVCLDRTSEEKYNQKKKNFRVEGEISKNLKHKNLVKTHLTYFKENEDVGVFSFVMDNEKNGNFANLHRNLEEKDSFFNINNYSEEIKHNFYLGENYAKFFLIQIIRGLNDLNQQNIVHLDIKMENVLIGKNLILKICDFSLFQFVGSNGIELKNGTHALMAPSYFKKINGSRFIPKKNAFKIDIYSLGIMLLEMVLKRFQTNVKELDYEKLIDILEKETKYIKTCTFLSEECKDLLVKMIEVDDDKRISLYEIMKHPFFRNLWDVEFLKDTFFGEVEKQLLELQKSNRYLKNKNINQFKYGSKKCALINKYNKLNKAINKKYKFTKK